MSNVLNNKLRSKKYKFAGTFVFITLLVLYLLVRSGRIDLPVFLSLEDDEIRNLEPYVEIFHDIRANLPFEQVKEQTFTPLASHLNFGYTDAAVWARVTLEKKRFPDANWLIEIGIPYLDQVDSYQEKDGQLIHYRKGRGISLRTEPFPHRDSLIPVHFETDGPSTIYLRFFSRDGTTVNGRLITEEYFIRQDRVVRLFLGGYFGVMLAMAIYNFFLFLALRDSRYGYYVFFTLAVSFNVAAHYEFLHEYFFRGSDWLNSRFNLYTFCIAIFASIQFVRHFLSTAERMPLLDRVFKFFLVAIVVVALQATIIPHPSSIWLFCVLLPLLVVILLAGMQGLRFRRDPPSRYFLIAFAIFITGVAIFSLRRFGLFAPSRVVNFTFLIGSVTETMLLSLALASQINILRSQKEEAQNKLIREIRDYNLSLERLKKELEEKVKARTANLQTSLQEKELLLKEVHHRVKNNLAVVVSLLGFQMMRTDKDSKANAVLQASRSRIQSMAFVHEILCANGNLAEINVKDYFNKLIAHLYNSYAGGKRNVEFSCTVEDIYLPMDVLIACGLITTELITNSLTHGFPGRNSGTVALSMKQDADWIVLRVADNGRGLTDSNDEHLGMRLVRIMSEQLNGHLEHLGTTGSCWQIRFPYPRKME